MENWTNWKSDKLKIGQIENGQIEIRQIENRTN